MENAVEDNIISNVSEKNKSIFVPAKILATVCTLALVGGRVNNDPSDAAATCAAPGSNNVLIAHDDCSKYYICSWGKPIVMDCPRPLLFNPEKKWCDWPDNVNCGNTENICGAEGSHGQMFAHEVCSKFYKCSFGIPYVYNCPPPLLFNIQIRQCDWPQNVDCGTRT